MLGFEVVATSDDNYWTMLQIGDATLMLNAAYEDHERPAEPDPVRVAAHSDTALFFGCDSADAVFSHLQAKGWLVKEPLTTQYGMRQVYTLDPDGYRICFQHADEPG